MQSGRNAEGYSGCPDVNNARAGCLGRINALKKDDMRLKSALVVACKPFVAT